jgi:hypothetical protein
VELDAMMIYAVPSLVAPYRRDAAMACMEERDGWLCFALAVE